MSSNPCLEAACAAYTHGDWPTGNDAIDSDIRRDMAAALVAANIEQPPKPELEASEKFSPKTVRLEAGKYVVCIDVGGSVLSVAYEGQRSSTGLPYGRYLITVDHSGCIVSEETETVARGTHIMDTDSLYHLQKAVSQCIPRTIGR